MTDIVERLRDWPVTYVDNDLMDEAADEIERLKAEIERLREDNKQLRAEIKNWQCGKWGD